jgi:hypothetical protein
MQVPLKIAFKQRTPNGSKIYAEIKGLDIPTSIQVKGTNDLTNVKIEGDRDRDRDRDNDRLLVLDLDAGRDREDDRDDRGDGDCGDHHPRNKKGYWESRNKYKTLQQTLLLFKDGEVVECKYDVNGNLIVEEPTAEIKDGTILVGIGSVDFAWTSVKEILVKEYQSQRKSGTEWITFEFDRAIGSNIVYGSTDRADVGGQLEYRLKVVFNDNTEKVLMTQTVNYNPVGPEVEIDQFGLSQAGVEVVANWKAGKESLLSHYELDRKYSSEAEYTLGVKIVPATGTGSTYSTTDKPVLGASIEYRLRAVYENDSDEILVTQSILTTVVPDATVDILNLVVPAENVISLSWNSIIENSVELYYFERKDPETDIFVKIENPQFAQGAGAAYATDDVVPAPGIYTYRLYAQFINNTPEPKLVDSNTVSVTATVPA